MIELGEYGNPKEISMPVERLDNISQGTRAVKYTIWASHEKPYQVILAKTALTSSEAHCIYDAVKRLGSGNYANLGVAAGRSTGCIAWGLKYNNHVGKVYAVDLFNWAHEKYQIVGLKKTLSSVIEYIEFCQGYTHDWGAKLKNLKFKFIFIDADHNYETCKEDWKLWSPLVEVGGEIAFHDTHMNTVDRVIKEIDYSEWEQINHIFTLKLFKKIK